MDNNSLFVGFSSSTGVLPWLIRLFSGTLASGGVNHMFLCWQDARFGWVTLGANANGITLIPWEQFTTKRKVIAMFRPKDSNLDLWKGLEQLRYEINEKYNYPAIVGVGMVRIAEFLLHKKFPNVLDKNKHELFCSEFATMVIRKAGFEFLDAVPQDEIKPQDALHELARRVDFVQGLIPNGN
jgi:hypothetical protein